MMGGIGVWDKGCCSTCCTACKGSRLNATTAAPLLPDDILPPPDDDVDAENSAVAPFPGERVRTTSASSSAAVDDAGLHARPAVRTSPA